MIHKPCLQVLFVMYFMEDIFFLFHMIVYHHLLSAIMSWPSFRRYRFYRADDNGPNWSPGEIAISRYEWKARVTAPADRDLSCIQASPRRICHTYNYLVFRLGRFPENGLYAILSLLGRTQPSLLRFLK